MKRSPTLFAFPLIMVLPGLNAAPHPRCDHQQHGVRLETTCFPCPGPPSTHDWCLVGGVTRPWERAWSTITAATPPDWSNPRGERWNSRDRLATTQTVYLEENLSEVMHSEFLFAQWPHMYLFIYLSNRLY